MLDKPNFNSVARTDASLSCITVPDYSVEIGFGFQKNDGGYALQSQMNEFLAKLKAEGKTDELINKWYGETEPQENIPLEELKANQKTLNVSIDTTRKPFVYMYEGKPVGFEIEVLYMFCKEYGYTDTELHLNEWSYIRGWHGEDWNYSIRARKSLKGASFISGVMAVCQDTELDMLMFYDAAPGLWNSMFHTDYKTPLKGYYPFKMFNELYKMGNFVRPEYEEAPIYCTAAIGDGGAGIMLTNYSDDDNAGAQTVTLKLNGVAGKTAEIYTLDNEKDCELTNTLTLSDELTLELPLFTTVCIKIGENA